MKEYPKVPRYNHPFVKPEWFTEDSVVIEKYDGSNFRFCLYDERFSDLYGDINANHGDFILGSKSVESHENDVPDTFPDELEFEQRLEYLRKNIDKDKLLEIYGNYGAPIIFYGENMVRHTLDYDWSITPEIILFDCYCSKYDDIEEYIGHPYKEPFTGFLEWDELIDFVDYSMDIPTARVIQRGIEYDEISEDIIGESEYANARAEGYVIRSDSHMRRTKVRTAEFIELNSKIWGSVTGDVPISKEIAYSYATSQRVKKSTLKMINEREYEPSKELLERLVPYIVNDIWVEEWVEFYDKTFNPYDIFKYVAERIQGTLIRPNLFGIPDELEQIADKWEFAGKHIPEPIEPTDYKSYVYSLVTDEVLDEIYENIVENNRKDAGNWVIQPLTDEVMEWIWYQKRDTMQRINTKIDGGEINDGMYNITVPYVKSK